MHLLYLCHDSTIIIIIIIIIMVVVAVWWSAVWLCGLPREFDSQSDCQPDSHSHSH